MLRFYFESLISVFVPVSSSRAEPPVVWDGPLPGGGGLQPSVQQIRLDLHQGQRPHQDRHGNVCDVTLMHAICTLSAALSARPVGSCITRRSSSGMRGASFCQTAGHDPVSEAASTLILQGSGNHDASSWSCLLFNEGKNIYIQFEKDQPLRHSMIENSFPG